MRDPAVAPDLGVVADPPEEPVGDPGRYSGSSRDLLGSRGLHRGPQDAGGTVHDLGQLLVRVVVKAWREAEPFPERQRDEPGPGRRGNQSEPREVEPEDRKSTRLNSSH